MIELFARPGSNVDFNYENHITHIGFKDDISSLSAILLNEEYYSFILKGRTIINDVCVLDALHIIPLKMRAYIDLEKQKTEGVDVDERDIRKHKYDVFRLYPLISKNEKVIVPGQIYSDIRIFIKEMSLSDFDLNIIHLPYNKKEILDVYNEIYVEESD